MKHLDFSQTIPVVIRNRSGILFQEDIKALTSLNNKGVFDILPLHENFISIIKDYIVMYRKNGETKEMKITEGVLEVYQDKISIFLEIFSKAF